MIIVFSIYFILLIGITFVSIYRIAHVKDSNFSSEYFVGGRKLGTLSLAILVAAGVCSTGTFVGGPGLAAQNGWGFIILFGFGQLIMNLFILGIVGKKINIIARRVEAETYIDVFRFRCENYKPLIFILILAILFFLIAAATGEFVGGSRVIESMAGIPFKYSLLAFGSIIIIYTALGGLRGVTSVAIMQGIVMTVASIILIVGFISHFGGITSLFNKAAEANPSGLTPGGGASLLEMMGYWLTYGIGVLGLAWAVQGTLGYGSVKTMKSAIIVGIVMVTFWSVFLSLGGLAGRAMFPDLSIPDLAVPKITEATLPGPIAGLVLAGVAGAGQSTIAALFILASGSLVVNGYKAFINPNPTVSRVRWLTIGTTCGIGIITIILAFNPPPSLQVYITFSQGGSAAAFAPALLLGLFWSRSNKYGALTGIITGLVLYVVFSQINLGISALSQAPLLFSAPASFILNIAVSLMTSPPTEDTVRTYFGDWSEKVSGPTEANLKIQTSEVDPKIGQGVK
jgi:sodium/pantothenate symporter